MYRVVFIFPGSLCPGIEKLLGKCEQITFIICAKFKLKKKHPLKNAHVSLTSHRLFHPYYVNTRADIDQNMKEVRSIDPFYLKAAHITLHGE